MEFDPGIDLKLPAHDFPRILIGRFRLIMGLAGITPNNGNRNLNFSQLPNTG